MAQCDSTGCVRRPQFEVQRLSTPMNASTSRLTEKLCGPCVEQDRRMGSPIRVMRTLTPEETGQILAE